MPRGKKLQWSRRLINRIHREYPFRSNTRAFAAQIGVGYSQLHSFASRQKIAKVTCVPRWGATMLSQAQQAYIRENYLQIPVNTMARHMDVSETPVKTFMRRQHLVRPREIVQEMMERGRIKPGTIPPNKGKKQVDIYTPEQMERIRANWYGKGHKPANSKHDGAITIRHNKEGGSTHMPPTKYIRIKGKWMPLQHYNWQQEHGPIPEGHRLMCKDGNHLNADASNWYPLSAADQVRRNSGSIHLSDGFVAFTIATKNNLELVPEILKRPDLIEAQRELIKLKRAIKDGHKQLAGNKE